MYVRGARSRFQASRPEGPWSGPVITAAKEVVLPEDVSIC